MSSNRFVIRSIVPKMKYSKAKSALWLSNSLASHATFPKLSYDKSGLPVGMFGTSDLQDDRLSFLKAGLTCADVITTFGPRAEKGIRLSPQDDISEILESRNGTVVSMNNGALNGSTQEVLAQKFVDLYRGLAKSN